MTDDEIHTPVLLERCLELMGAALGGAHPVAVDATLGLGGHAAALLTRFPSATLVGIDRDAEALAIARERLARFGDRVRLLHAVDDDLPALLASAGTASADAVLFDLGVSSLQIDRSDRGFSYSRDAPLDMRMDADGPVTAEDVLAEYDEERLRRLFRDYGDEPLAARYARRIVAERGRNRLTRSTQLARILAEATPRSARRTGHPAKRVFQALRIEVNEELAVLERGLPRALDALAVGGRAVVMSYHSLEDRIVKRLFAERCRSSAPVDLPVEPAEFRPRFRALTRGAEKASDEERARNPRSASVRLRAVERVEAAA